MAAIFVVVLVLWVTEALPVGMTALLAGGAAARFFGVADLPTAFTTFISPVFFFVLAMFVVAQAFISSGLDRRFSLWLLSKAGTDSRRVVWVFMVGTCLVSTIMSDVPATAIFMALAVGLFDKMGLTPGRSSFAKGGHDRRPPSRPSSAAWRRRPAAPSTSSASSSSRSTATSPCASSTGWSSGSRWSWCCCPSPPSSCCASTPPEMDHVTAVGDVAAETDRPRPGERPRVAGPRRPRHHDRAVDPQHVVPGPERGDGEHPGGRRHVPSRHAHLHVEGGGARHRLGGAADGGRRHRPRGRPRSRPASRSGSSTAPSGASRTGSALGIVAPRERVHRGDPPRAAHRPRDQHGAHSPPRPPRPVDRAEPRPLRAAGGVHRLVRVPAAARRGAPGQPTPRATTACSTCSPPARCCRRSGWC